MVIVMLLFFKNKKRFVKSEILFLSLILLLMLSACGNEDVDAEIELGEAETIAELAESTSGDYADAAQTPAVDPVQEAEPDPEDTTEEPAQPDITESTEPEAESTEAPTVEEIPEVTQEPPQPITLPREPAVLSKETLLADFDYFTHTLEDSFPFYGPVRRKFGVDLRAQTNSARTVVENLNTANSEAQILRDFANILSGYVVTPMRTMGHMIGLWNGTSTYNVQLAQIKWDGASETPWYPNLYARHLHDIFTSPTATRYYGKPLEGIDIDNFIQSNLFTPTADNVSFSILQENSIAYIRMKTMNVGNYASDGKLIAAFAETIGEFDHLIIDLRGNTGGNTGNFTQYIMAPLIKEPATLGYYVFFKAGEHALQFDDIYSRDVQWQVDNGLTLHTDAPRFSVGDILPSLTNANAEDFASLKYGFKREITVTPSASQWAFDGKIWVLIDGRSYSAAEISAAIAKESGFATLVGEPTFGSFGGYTAAFINLPNTGIIIRYDYGYVTDLQGRSLEEYGITPHITNRPGMDALSTALALIAEGNY